MNRMRTFIKYPGGKTKELRSIRENLPPIIDRYFEPFVGGGSVFFDLSIDKSYINDISEDLVILYEFIKNKDEVFLHKLNLLNEMWKKLNEYNWKEIDFSSIFQKYNISCVFNNFKEIEEVRKKKINERHPDGNEDFKDLLSLTIVKAAFYYTVRYVYNQERRSKNPDIVLKVLCYYYIREFCFSSMFRFSLSGDFNVPYGGSSYNNKNFDNKIKLITGYHFKDVEIFNDDYKVFLNRFDFNETDFIFVDPPYDTKFNDYDGNSFDRLAQIQLAEELSRLNANIMIVIKNTDFIYNLYKEKGFKIISFDKKYNVNFQNRNARDVKHLLITNY